MVRVRVIGASGYTGVELLRLLARTPSSIWPSPRPTVCRNLADRCSVVVAYPGSELEPFDAAIRAGGLDVVFLGLCPTRPPSASCPSSSTTSAASSTSRQRSASAIGGLPALVRLRARSARTAPPRVYGLPERTRADLRRPARRHAGVLRHGGDAGPGPDARRRARRSIGDHRRRASGVSGAGALSYGTAFCTVDENFTAYGLLDHRHTPEIEQNLAPTTGDRLHAAPGPMNRGSWRPATPARRGVELSTDRLLDELTKATATSRSSSSPPSRPRRRRRRVPTWRS